MKIIVISDTHGNIRAIEEVARNNSDAYIILHLGDGIKDIKAADRNDIGFVAVKGNCDRSYSDEYEEETLCINLDGIRIMMTHGHRYSAKITKDLLLSQALKEHADICLFGHTHIMHDDVQIGVRLLNPGSLGYDGTYIILDTDNGIQVKFEKI
ncbi:MAG: metallophosphoesterase [Anaerofustis stercorihominis]|nr:metallophosphoesterase [Anaerofustis stercorihominis]